MVFLHLMSVIAITALVGMFASASGFQREMMDIHDSMWAMRFWFGSGIMTGMAYMCMYYEGKR